MSGVSSVALTNSPTITSPALMTGVGVLLGTAAYMSPEQAKGRPADKRSDIWAFGCVLFEMVTGQRAFAGDDVADTLAHVLTKEPTWNVLPATAPQPLTRLLRRCLARRGGSLHSAGSNNEAFRQSVDAAERACLEQIRIVKDERSCVFAVRPRTFARLASVGLA